MQVQTILHAKFQLIYVQQILSIYVHLYIYIYIYVCTVVDKKNATLDVIPTHIIVEK